ncbi:MAG: hypothetical protein LBH40_03345 [Alphaproteobacteria bacterium]|jgi:hypothetical protein|nr:hypothetical protein [Alphaproteobacteria bacterium]
MIIKSYPQFSKKAFFLGLDKKFFLLFVFIQAPMYFILMLTFTALVSIAIVGSSFLFSVIAFAKNNYVLEQKLTNLILKFKYKDINNILPR